MHKRPQEASRGSEQMFEVAANNVQPETSKYTPADRGTFTLKGVVHVNNLNSSCYGTRLMDAVLSNSMQISPVTGYVSTTIHTLAYAHDSSSDSHGINEERSEYSKILKSCCLASS